VTALHTMNEVAGKLRPQPILGKYIYIYFIQTGDFIKIGQSLDWKKRIGNIKTASPYESKLLHVELNVLTFEASCHKRFKRLHHRGEWFRADRKLLDFINQRIAEKRSWI
jgi:hypothetical protein